LKRFIPLPALADGPPLERAALLMMMRLTHRAGCPAETRRTRHEH
jgi:hypothetical protein